MNRKTASGRESGTGLSGGVALGALALLFVPGSLAAQGAPCEALAAPVESTALTVGGTEISVCYSAPAAEGRAVFGHSIQFADTWVVPYDTLWHTGVVFETPAAVEMAGVSLDPGTYALYAVPSSFEWTIIVSSGVEDFVNGVRSRTRLVRAKWEAVWCVARLWPRRPTG